MSITGQTGTELGISMSSGPSGAGECYGNIRESVHWSDRRQFCRSNWCDIDVAGGLKPPQLAAYFVDTVVRR
jgi:hypothetical protein